jgi:hypothetical protein
MARTNIDVVITVRDGASQPLDNVTKKIKSTGKAAKDASLDFVQFNKTLFTTTAFVATFVKGITSLRNSMEMGGDLERLSNQYERLLGPKGALFRSIDSMTTTAIARMDALKAGVDLRNLGIAKSSEQVAEIIAKAGTAAKLSGIDAGEGIEKFTNFLKDGSVANLEALGLIKRTDPQFQALLATLNKAGGVYGTVISTQAKLNIGMALLNKRVEGQLKNLRDLKDLTLLLNDSFSIMKRQIGSLLGQALRPLIEKLIPLIYKFGDVLEQIRKNEKHIVFLVRAFTILTGSVAGLVAALGTLKLAIKLLGFAGFGLPGLVAGVLWLTTAFIGLTHAAQGPMEKLRVLGAIFKGIYELVTNLDPETGMSKISKSTKALLEKYGLLDFVKTISRIVATTKRVVQDLGNVFQKVADKLDKITGGLFNGFKNYMSDFTKDWTTWWTSDAISDLQKFVRAAKVILTPLAAYLGFKVGKWALGKVAGGFLGSFGGKNDGSSPSKALWVQNIGDKLTGFGAGLGDKVSGLGGKFLSAILSALGLKTLGAQFKNLGKILQLSAKFLLKLDFKNLGRALSLLPPLLGRLGIQSLSVIGRFGAIGAAAVAGYQLGKVLTELIPGLNKLGDWAYNLVNKDKMSAADSDEDIKARYEHAKKMGWDRGRTFEQYKEDVLKQKSNTPSSTSGKQTQVSVPSPSPLPEDQHIIQALGEQMKNMEEKDRVKMQSALESALASPAGNRSIDPEEFKMFDQMVQALDSSENLTTLANKAKENASNLKGSKRD